MQTTPTDCPCPPCLAKRCFDLAYDAPPCELSPTEPAGPAPLVDTYAGRPCLTDAGIALLRTELAISHDSIVDPVRIMRGVAPELDLAHEDLRASLIAESRDWYRGVAECVHCTGDEECAECGDSGLDDDVEVPRLVSEGRVVCACCLGEAHVEFAWCPECDQALRAVARSVVRAVVAAEEAGKVAAE